MGTWTSGNTEQRCGARRCVDEFPHITLPALRLIVGSIEHFPLDGHQAGVVKMGGVRVLLWSLTGRCLKVAHNGPEGKAIETPVHFDWTEAGFGGRRWWMLCPTCGESRTGLYGRWGRLACRECQELTYRSTRQTTRQRNLEQVRNRQERVRYRLIDGWDKPPRMRWTTYRRLIEELCALDEAEHKAIRAYAIPSDWSPPW